MCNFKMCSLVKENKGSIFLKNEDDKHSNNDYTLLKLVNLATDEASAHWSGH